SVGPQLGEGRREVVGEQEARVAQGLDLFGYEQVHVLSFTVHLPQRRPIEFLLDGSEGPGEPLGALPHPASMPLRSPRREGGRGGKLTARPVPTDAAVRRGPPGGRPSAIPPSAPTGRIGRTRIPPWERTSPAPGKKPRKSNRFPCTFG